MKLSNSTKQAYSEVYEIINLLDESDKIKIPLKLRNYFEMERDKEYNKKIDSNIPLKTQSLKRETLSILAMLNLNYLCTDNKEKERLKKRYIENEKIYQKELREKYNADNLFKNENKAEKEEKIEELAKEQQALAIKKTGFFQKIINFFKNIFKK